MNFVTKVFPTGTVVVEIFAASCSPCRQEYRLFTLKASIFLISRRQNLPTYYSLKEKKTHPQQGTVIGVVLESWRILQEHIFHFDFVRETASCSTSKETKR